MSPSSAENSRKRRIGNELVLLYEMRDRVEIHKIEDTTIIYIKSTEGRLQYTFILGGDYPFRTPEIYVGESAQSYENFLSFYKIAKIKPEITLLFQRPCICCHTFMSRSYWSPRYNSVDIMNEAEFMRHLKWRVVRLYLLRKIAAARGGGGLGDDIVREIFTYVSPYDALLAQRRLSGGIDI